MEQQPKLSKKASMASAVVNDDDIRDGLSSKQKQITQDIDEAIRITFLALIATCSLQENRVNSLDVVDRSNDKWARRFLRQSGTTLLLSEEVISGSMPFINASFGWFPFSQRKQTAHSTAQQQQGEGDSAGASSSLGEANKEASIDHDNQSTDDALANSQPSASSEAAAVDKRKNTNEDDGMISIDRVESAIIHADSAPLILKMKESMNQEQMISLIQYCLMSNVLEFGQYDSRSRAAFKRLCQALGIDWDNYLEPCEHALAVRVEDLERAMKNAEKRKQEEEERKTRQKVAEEEKKREAQKASGWRWVKVGAATATGGVLLAATGLIAAPAIAAGVMALGGAVGLTGVTAAVGGFLASAGGTALVTSLFGVGGAGLTGVKMARRVSPLTEFGFLQISNQNRADPSIPLESLSDFTHHRHLSVTICVSGYMKRKDELLTVWGKSLQSFSLCGPLSDASPCKYSDDRFTLVWERKELVQFGTSIESLALDEAVNIAAKEAIKQTALNVLVSAVSWPLTVVKTTSIIDNPFGIVCNRADFAGEELALSLIGHQQGHRPVTLVGFSVGSLVIFRCLEHLAKHGATGIVEDVFLFGSCVDEPLAKWRDIRNVVSGRIVNGYSRNDWVLQFIYRAHSYVSGRAVAGLSPVPECAIENVDLSDVIKSHFDYSANLEKCLSLCASKKGNWEKTQ